MNVLGGRLWTSKKTNVTPGWLQWLTYQSATKGGLVASKRRVVMSCLDWDEPGLRHGIEIPGILPRHSAAMRDAQDIVEVGWHDCLEDYMG